MMTANLVGFVVGIDGVTFLASQLFGTWDGARFMVLAITCLFMGVQLMFEYRYVIFPIRYLLRCQLFDWEIFFKGGRAAARHSKAVLITLSAQTSTI